MAIRFLQFAGCNVAYAVSGEGPPLVAPAWWVSHLELDWQDMAFRSFWQSVGAGHTMVRYDRLGVGMSDRQVPPGQLSLDGEVELLGAVLDELALDKVVLVGGSSGGCAAIAYAARFPERVSRLLLYGAYANGPEITSPEVQEAVVAAVRSHWGLGSRLLADIFLGDASSDERERFARSSAPRQARRWQQRYWSSSTAMTFEQSCSTCRRRCLWCTAVAIVRSHIDSAVSSLLQSRALRWSRSPETRISHGLGTQVR